MDGFAVRVAGLSFTYDKSDGEALKKVDFDIPKGKFAAVMGETGAGKSTLLMALNGLVPQFYEGRLEGKVEVEGRSAHEVPVQNMAQTVGLVLQDPESQIFALNVWEDAAFGPSNLGIPLNEIRQRVAESLRLAGLSGYEAHLTEHLSGGEKQRLAIAGILALRPAVLALDEPSSELDPEGKEAIFRIAKELQREHGMTIVMAEHESEPVLEFADEVHVLQDGQCVWSGRPARLFADETKVRTFGLRPPGVAEVFWKLRREGVDLGPDCPRTAAEMKEMLTRCFAAVRAVERQGLPETPADRLPETAGFAAGPERSPILQVKDLHHRYPNGHLALAGVSLDIYDGEYLAVIGHNGAGKSTLCKHLNRLLKPTRGDVRFRCENISGRETWELAADIGYVFQNPDHQIFCPTVLEEAAYGLKAQGRAEAERNRRAREVLEFVGLDRVSDRHPFALDKGERKRLALASALAMGPKVLIVDEPTAGLDWRGGERMLELLRQLHRAGHTIVAITHNMRIAAGEAGRTLIMSEGKVLKICHPADIFADPEILKTTHVKPTQIAELARALESDIRLSSGSVTSQNLAAAVLERMGIRHA